MSHPHSRQSELSTKPCSTFIIQHTVAALLFSHSLFHLHPLFFSPFPHPSLPPVFPHMRSSAPPSSFLPVYSPEQPAWLILPPLPNMSVQKLVTDEAALVLSSSTPPTQSLVSFLLPCSCFNCLISVQCFWCHSLVNLSILDRLDWFPLCRYWISQFHISFYCLFIFPSASNTFDETHSLLK